jgi:hypothetical protein
LFRRRIKGAIAIVGGCAVGYALLPELVENRVHHAFEARGFPDAAFEVSSFGLDHLHLRDVHLEPGADIGSLELGAGVSLLWRDLDDVTIRDARVTDQALARIAHKLRPPPDASPGTRVNVDSVTIEDSLVHVGDTAAAVDGKITPRGGTLDIRVTVREPVERGWTVAARGRVVLGKQVELEAAHVDVTMPHRSLGRATVENTTLSADASGNLSTLAIESRGTVRGNVEIGGVSITNATADFSFDRKGLRVSSLRAHTAGGMLTVDPFVIGPAPTDLVIHARGLELAALAEPTEHVTGTGLVDGELSFQLADSGVAVRRASLRARRGGTLQIRDSKLRERLARMESPLAIHVAIANALADFQFSELSVELGPKGADPELRVATRGLGRRNRQPLDIAIQVRGVHEVLPRLTRGVR